MPNRMRTVDPVLLRLPQALRARMVKLDHTQMDVERLTGVPQPQISRALNGVRKRLTGPMSKLCLYAELSTAHRQSATVGASVSELSRLLEELLGDSPAAAEIVKGVLLSLAPLVAGYRPRGYQ